MPPSLDSYFWNSNKEDLHLSLRLKTEILKFLKINDY